MQRHRKATKFHLLSLIRGEFQQESKQKVEQQLPGVRGGDGGRTEIKRYECEIKQEVTAAAGPEGDRIHNYVFRYKAYQNEKMSRP